MTNRKLAMRTAIAAAAVIPWSLATGAEEYVVRKPDGSVQERISRNPYTGGLDIRDRTGKRIGVIERNPYVSGYDVRRPDGRRLKVIEPRKP